MRISQCREEDLELLEAHMPLRGAATPHEARYARQRQGSATFLLAWKDRRPVGSCEIRWAGCEAPEVRAAHPGCPEVHGLGVWHGALRAQNISTALLREVERLAAERGCRAVGLGVEKNNPRASALYGHLGYRDSVPYLDCWSYQDGAGVVHRVADACLFMVKKL
ncbi:GNAT family N-acetyltransferase [Streptomyces qinglanensis]|uniref:Acetyltransferase (GNAT) family protein n=1 Tax=Streptomyces qinglanensis TaxID=943816 RepID=A0A1H9S1Z5_9ACTN|nr:GNAT family N-acetyltransferase [Streptomyces qinglanensis]SER78645.1 Acetyltransferase (GNAT) family protein [Streptomyces qinglanensis]